MAKILNILLKYFKKHPLFMLYNLSFTLLIPVQNVYLPRIYGRLISSIKSNYIDTNLFIYIIVLLALIQVGHALSSEADVKFYPDFQSFIRTNMIEMIFNKFENDYKELEMGQLISKFIKLPAYISKWYDKLKGYIIPYIMVYIFAIILFFNYDKILGISLFLLLFIFISTIIIFLVKSFKLSIDKDNKHNDIQDSIEDILKNLVSVYSYNEKEQELKNIKEIELKYKNSYEIMMKTENTIRLYITPLIVLFLIVFLLRSSNLTKNKGVDFKQFIPVFVILMYILNSIVILTDQFKELLFDIGILFNFEHILSFQKDYNLNKLHKELLNNNDGIIFENVSMKYNNKYIFNNLNLHIKHNDKIALIGPVGSGKSTIVKLILKLKKPTEGNIYYNGINYKNIDTDSLRKKIGYIQQNSTIFNRTIIENIKYGNNTEDYIIQDIFDKYKLNQYINNIYENAGNRGDLLSGGQKQIILAIRLILSKPEIIILDEHTSALDNNLKHLITKIIFDNCQDKMIIIISHDNEIINYAQRKYYIQKNMNIN